MVGKATAANRKNKRPTGAMNSPNYARIKGDNEQKKVVAVEVEFGESQIRSDFVVQQNNHLGNSLRFADAKAGAIVTVNGVVLTYVIALLENSTGYSTWVFMGSLIFLIGGMLSSIAVVFPKTMNNKEKGLVYWEHIVNNTQDEYEKQILVDDTNQLLKSSIANNYIQALILTKKFKQLKFSFQVSVVAYLIILMGLLSTFFL